MSAITKADNAATTLPSRLEAEARLKIDQVEVLTGWRKSKIYNEVKLDRFPQPERRGLRCTRWRAGDVLEWLEKGRAASKTTASRG